MPYRCASCGRFMSDEEKKIWEPIPDPMHLFVDDWAAHHPACLQRVGLLAVA